MKISAILSTFLLVFVLSCGGNQQQQAPQKEEQAAQQESMEQSTQQAGIQVDLAQLASPKCMGCGMDMTKHAIMDTVTYEGKLYAFCSKECKEKFLSDPEKHIHQHMGEHMEHMEGKMEQHEMEHEHGNGEQMEHHEKMEHKMGTKEEVRKNVEY